MEERGLRTELSDVTVNEVRSTDRQWPMWKRQSGVMVGSVPRSDSEINFARETMSVRQLSGESFREARVLCALFQPDASEELIIDRL